MLKIPFPVCAYVLVVFHFCNKLWQLYKHEMELLTCGPASLYMCQLFTDLQRVITTLPFELVLLVIFFYFLEKFGLT